MKRSQFTRRAAGWTDEAVRHIDAAGCDIAVVRRPPPVECGALFAGGTLGAVRFTTATRGAASKIDRALARLDLVIPARQRAAVADDLLDRLEACCLTDDEMNAGPVAWLDLPDPFPAWRIATDGDDEALGDTIEV